MISNNIELFPEQMDIYNEIFKIYKSYEHRKLICLSSNRGYGKSTIAEFLSNNDENVIYYNCDNSVKELDPEDEFKNKRIIGQKLEKLIQDITREHYKDYLIIFDHLHRLFFKNQSGNINYLLFRKSPFLSLGGTILLIVDKIKDVNFDFKCLKVLKLIKPSSSSLLNYVKLYFKEIATNNLTEFQDYNSLIGHIKYIQSKEG